MSLTIWLAGLLILTAAPAASAQQRLDVLARVGPWPVASNLIAYRGRLWFCNSVKGRNHNSADIWSLDPATGEVRYERHLFSQDAGRPVVFNNLLYWPYEDPRLSLGYGLISVTDGKGWSQLGIKTAQIFHVHSAVNWDGTLVAVTSAWRAGLQVSDDGGASWSHLYGHPTPAGRVSRLHLPTFLLGRLFFRLRDPDGTRLVWLQEDSLTDVRGWPKQSFHSLTAHGSFIFGLVEDGAKVGLWRTTGRKSELVPDIPNDGQPIALHAAQDRLWMLLATEGGGYVASSENGRKWQVVASFSGGTARELTVSGKQILVGGAGADGRSIIWGIRGAALPGSDTPPTFGLPEPLKIEGLGDIDWQQQSDRLKAALRNPASFQNHGRGGLRENVRNILALSPPADFLSEHLAFDMPDTRVGVIGGERRIPARDMGQWILMWGMAATPGAVVPVDYLFQPWTQKPVGSEKYFDPLLAAMLTISRAGQDDRRTIAALIERLKADRDPLWLKGDVVGTLNAITGQTFGYDAQRWLDWWRRHEVE